MHSTRIQFLDKLITPLLLIAAGTLAMATFATSAAAASLGQHHFAADIEAGRGDFERLSATSRVA